MWQLYIKTHTSILIIAKGNLFINYNSALQFAILVTVHISYPRVEIGAVSDLKSVSHSIA